MPHHPTQSKYISKGRAADRYGKNHRTITRWVHDSTLAFPQPAKINGRWFFVEAELDEFDRRLATARLQDLTGQHQTEVAVQRTQSAGGVA